MGPSCNNPIEKLDPRKDVNKYHMLIVQPSYSNPIWLGKVLGDVYKDMANMEREWVMVKWWKQNAGYVGWDEKTKEWIVGQDKDDIIDVDSIIWTWKLWASAKEDDVEINEKGTYSH